MDTIQDSAKLFAGLRLKIRLLQEIADHEFTDFTMHFATKSYFISAQTDVLGHIQECTRVL